jgi:hypothetical protein
VTLPQGVYRGRALGWWRPFNLFWKGKTFTGSTVTNRILGMEFIRGDVWACGDPLRSMPDMMVITYWFGLKDVLVPCVSGYRGTMALGPLTVRFTLQKETP